MATSTDIEAFRGVLKSSKSIVAVVGAGLSAASGIPTFRDFGGLWNSYDPLEFSTPQGFLADPSQVWQFYHQLRELSLHATPNAGHIALAVLCVPENLRIVAPLARFTIITQNIDGLDICALKEVIAKRVQDHHFVAPLSTSQIFEIHGRVVDTLCTVCGHRESRTESPLCQALKNVPFRSETYIPEEDLPHCCQPGCGGLLRPGVVWFDEVPHHLKDVYRVVDEADLCLVIGTSSTVSPAAGFAYEVTEHGGKVAIFNIDSSDDERADFFFAGPCEETLPRIFFDS
ncbi:NAD-dependent protein [Sparassis crispa]|uniref:NAD-dependent protein n=1 Tax=Sparassis crispa TaxID=139825 RepID=A0A401G9F0_9APHY|nr:NAD-dependent protein [Sparassis crispa]GBE78763.1 NAD-dependent protein [Sparassis crispa]